MKVRDVSIFQLRLGTVLNLQTSVMGSCPPALLAKSQERSMNAPVEGINLREGKNGGNCHAWFCILGLI